MHSAQFSTHNRVYENAISCMHAHIWDLIKRTASPVQYSISVPRQQKKGDDRCGLL
jgi:hypothetical protein